MPRGRWRDARAPTFTALWRALSAAALAAAPASSWASTGVCDSNPPTSTQACISAIEAQGGVVNDIFRDSNGRTGPSLPLLGKLFDNHPGCGTANCICLGTSNAPYDCPGNFSCQGGTSFADVAMRVNGLDHIYGNLCRLVSHAAGGACPVFGGGNCVTDGTTGGYYPWEGYVFDLGGPSNQVVVFAENDHGPQPCESLEYTVYLSDNPLSQDRVQDPATAGVDPTKWNRAVLKKVFTEGWYELRPPDPAGHATCGDTALYSVESDSFAMVYALPCGITFRYAAAVAGNDGLDFPACAFDSFDAELNAVAGLTESGAGVCPDADGDLFVDCSCPGAPPVCDCNDADPTVHPGAPESCDDPDKNCDGKPGACAGALVCYEKRCLPTCGGEVFTCPAGSSCGLTPEGRLCLPADCTVAGCPAGSVCDAARTCVPACTGVVCPDGQVCQDGACLDPCASLVCPNQQVCVTGKCQVRCDCFADDVGCPSGQACDRNNSNLCVDPACKGVVCPAGSHCKAGICVGLCDGVVCPVDGNPCTSDGCDPVVGCGHFPEPDGTSCSDGDPCNGLETCAAGACKPGAPPDCDDKNPCTADSCDKISGCLHASAPDGTSCSDGDPCNGLETCAAGACKPGAPPDCDDKNPCTADSCDKISGCLHQALACPDAGNDGEGMDEAAREAGPDDGTSGGEPANGADRPSAGDGPGDRTAQEESDAPGDGSPLGPDAGDGSPHAGDAPGNGDSPANAADVADSGVVGRKAGCQCGAGGQGRADPRKAALLVLVPLFFAVRRRSARRAGPASALTRPASSGCTSSLRDSLSRRAMARLVSRNQLPRAASSLSLVRISKGRWKRRYSSSCHCSARLPGQTTRQRWRSPRAIISLMRSLAMMVLPAPGSSASRKRSGWRGSISS